MLELILHVANQAQVDRGRNVYYLFDITMPDMYRTDTLLHS